MKKGLKIALLIFFGLIIFIVVGSEFALNSSIATKIIENQAANMLDGTLGYSKLRVSLWRSFPKLKIRLEDLSLTYDAEGKAATGGASVSAAATASEMASASASNGASGEVTGSGLVSAAAMASEMASASASNGVSGEATGSGLVSAAATASEMASASASNGVSGEATGGASVSAAAMASEMASASASNGVSGEATGSGLVSELNAVSGSAAIPAGAAGSEASRKAGSVELSTPQDTLLNLKLLTLTADVWKAIKGDIRVEELKLKGLNLNAIKYNKDEANWQIYHFSSSSSDSSSFLQSIVVDTLSFQDFRISYKSLEDSLNAQVSACSLLMAASASFPQGNLQLDSLELDFATNLQLLTPSIRLENSKMNLGAKARTNKDKLSVELNKFAFSAPGAKLALNAKTKDLLANDPNFSMNLSLNTVLSEVGKIMPSLNESLGLDGKISLELDAKTSLSEINSLRFKNSVVHGKIESESLKFNMDSLNTEAFKTSIALSAEPDGLMLDMVFDSVYFSQGTNLTARLRELKAGGSISKKEFRGQLLPHINLHSSGLGAFVKLGSNRVALSKLALNLDARKKPEFVKSDSLSFRRQFSKDTLRMGRDSLRTRRNRNRADIKQQFENERFEISLDSTLVGYFKQWSPSGHIEIDKGIVISPLLPLRTRLNSFDFDFSERNISIDTLSLVCGTSDISAKGEMKGLFRALTRQSRISGNLDLYSKRLNANELLAALSMGKEDTEVTAVEDEGEDSFVVDSLVVSDVSSTEIPLIVVPVNLDLGLSLKSDRVDYADFEVTNLSTGIRLKDRTLQLTDTELSTNFANLSLSAFYSTKSKDDISAGLDLRLNEIKVNDLISLMPTVDELMPALRSFHGLLGCEISGTAQLDTAMNVIIPSIDGLVRISGKEMEIKDAGSLRKLTRLLLFRNKNIGKINNLQVDALIRNGQVELFPFELTADRYSFALRGTQNMDGTMFYHASVLRSPFLIPFGINIYGTLDNWRFSLCRAKYRSGKVAVYTQEIDNVQVNLAESIRNIYKKGVDNVMKHNAATAGNIALDNVQEAALLDASDYQEIDNMLFEQELLEQETALLAEVDAVLEETAIDTAKLLDDYQKSIYDEKIDKKIKQLQKESKKKKK